MDSTTTIEARPDMRSRAIVCGALGVALAAGLAAWGTFGEAGVEHSVTDYLVALAIIGVGAAVVFGWIVPRGLRKESAGGTAVALAVLAVLSIAMFWSGLPPVLAAGSVVLGLAGWNARRGAWLCRAAVVIAAFAIVGDLVVYIQDMT